jgi:hypothetical protein
MNTFCFFHICTIGNFYQKIVDEIFEYIEKSDLSAHITAMHVNIAGNGNIILPSYPWIKINSVRSKIEDYEFSTLNQLQSFAANNLGNVLYLHTKGVSTPNNLCIDEWRKYMLYFNITHYKKALTLLNNYDAVGVDLVTSPALHFSGNMWWSKLNHIKKLQTFEKLPLILSERHKAEFWICSDPTCQYASMNNSNINVYQRHLTRYPSHLYETNN